MYLGFQQINLPYVQKIEKIHNLFQGVHMRLHVKIIVVCLSLIKIVFAGNDAYTNLPVENKYKTLRTHSSCGVSDEENSPKDTSFNIGNRTFSQTSFGGSPRRSNIPTSDSTASLSEIYVDHKVDHKLDSLRGPDSLHRTTPPEGISSPNVKKTAFPAALTIITCHNTTPPGGTPSPKFGKK